MSKPRIKRFKNWWQIVKDGYTVTQFLSRTQAESFLDICSDFPAAQLNLGEERVSQKKGFSMRRISIYP